LAVNSGDGAFVGLLASGRQDARSRAISALAVKWPLTAKQLHSVVSKDGGKELTYQAVHKLARQMAADGTLAVEGGSYALDLGWVRQLKDFGASAERRYLRESSGLVESAAGSSVERSAFEAGKEAASKAVAQLRRRKPLQLVMVFASSAFGAHYEELLRGVRSVTAGAPLAGCTTMGEINNGALHKTVTVGVVAADESVFSAVSIALQLKPGQYSRQGFSGAMDQLGEEIAGSPPDFGLVFFPGYSKANGMKVVAPSFLGEFASRFSTPFPLAGCLAGDYWAFEKTTQFCGRHALADAIVFVGVKTSLKFAIRRQHGYKPASKRAYELRVRNQLVTEMALVSAGGKKVWKPALDVYLREAGTSAAELKNSVPLFIRELIARNRSPPITRAVDGVHGYPTFLEGKAIMFDNAFFDGDVVQLSKTSTGDILEATRNAVSGAMRACRTQP